MNANESSPPIIPPERRISLFGDIKTPQTAIVSTISLLVGACFGYLFLTLNDFDKINFGTILIGWLVLCPAAFVFALWPRTSFVLSGLTMISGIFLGVCVRSLTPPFDCNIWPIAAAIWAALFFIPVAAGALAGGFGGRWLRKVMK